MKYMIAYLDPGTGSMMLQSVIGAALGTVYVGRKSISGLIATIRKRTSSKKLENS